MRPVVAWTLLLLLLAVTAWSLLAPWEAVLGLAVFGTFALRRGRSLFVAFAALTVLLDAVLLAWADPGSGPTWQVAGTSFGRDGAVAGAIGGLRLTGALAVNLSALQWARPAAWLEALHLPPRPTAFLAALLIAAQDLGRDAGRLRDARRMDGTWPAGRWAQVRVAAGFVAPLLVVALERARIRHDALRSAGIRMRPGFVPLVAITAAALAGRLALVAVPNVSLTYVVVFAGGLVAGPWVGLGAGALAMALSDVLLSGWVPTAFVNVPAMALVGLLGGTLRRLDLGEGPGAAALYGLLGVAVTVLFSIAADMAEWWLVPEFRGDLDFLRVRLAAGLVFNALPAVTNGVLFAVVVGPVRRAFRAVQGQ